MTPGVWHNLPAGELLNNNRTELLHVIKVHPDFIFAPVFFYRKQDDTQKTCIKQITFGTAEFSIFIKKLQ